MRKNNAAIAMTEATGARTFTIANLELLGLAVVVTEDGRKHNAMGYD